VAKLLIQRKNLVKSEILQAWEDEVLCQYPEIDESPNISFDACFLFVVFTPCNNSFPVDENVIKLIRDAAGEK
jgi:hypothetical protein